MAPAEVDKGGLVFERADKSKDFKDIYGHNLDIFSESPDFKWTYDDIKREVEEEGWELYSVKIEQDIIAALFFKVDESRLLTKNTALKMNFQGSGYSHRIKEFFESVARRHRIDSIVHYCRIDDFRAYSLNESHGYRRMEDSSRIGDRVVAWIKRLSSPRDNKNFANK